MARIPEDIELNGTSFKLDIFREKTYTDILEKYNIPYTILKESEQVAYGFGIGVYCEVYKYVSPKTDRDCYVYEYVENHGPDGFGSYVAVTYSDEKVNIVKLYDVIMSSLRPE